MSGNDIGTINVPKNTETQAPAYTITISPPPANCKECPFWQKDYYAETHHCLFGALDNWGWCLDRVSDCPIHTDRV